MPGTRRAGTRRAGWVVLAWLAGIGLVTLAVPPLESVVAADSTPVVPEDAPSVRTLATMDEEFGNGRSASVLFVVVERDGGLTRADRAFVKRLVPRLRRDERVSFVQDVARRPALLQALTSRDGEAAYLQVGIPGSTGAPTSISQVEAVRDIVQPQRPDGLEVAVTGPTATIADMSTEVEHSLVRITVVTVGLIAVILLLLYRSIPVAGLILAFIGIALAAARGFTAWAGLNVFSVSTFTAAFITGVTLGAATDYAIFLVSRYQELRRSGVEHRAAVATATRRVAAVIAGSALTVVVASACMALAELGLFRTTGPAIALSVAGTLALSLTLLPALLLLVGARGHLDPRPLREGRRTWDRVAAYAVARPARVLALGLLPLLLLASFYPLLSTSFDERSGQPESTESNRGYRMIAAHYPANEVLADFVLVTADRDLRNVRDLAALEQAAASVSRTDGVELVRSVTRPLGKPIAQATTGYHAGVVGRRLGGAGEQLSAGEDGARRLTDGAGRLTDGAVRLADGAGRAVSGADRLVGGVRELRDGLDRLATGAGAARTGAGDLRAGADRLADGLETAVAQTQVAVDGLGLAHDALRQSLTCGLDPVCAQARDGVRRVYEGERDKLLPGLRAAATAARQIADGTVRLDVGLARIESGLGRAEAGTAELATGQQTMRSSLARLAGGADRVADASGQVAGGTARIQASVGELRGGLTRAATHLRRTAKASRDPAIGGFYLPPVAMRDQRFAASSSVFLSPDGRTARMLVLGESDAFQRPATERAGEVRDAAEAGLRGTSLAGTPVQTTGIATLNGDLEDYSDKDFTLVAAVALVAVFLILFMVLRSVVVALLLLASVVLSYVSAMGLAVLVWQIGLDRPLEWTVPTIAFVLLVAVGADYNLLLMKRVREEALDGSRAGIARAVSATGGVITAAGLIFAASMFALMAGSVTTLAQMGFTIAMGLLLDTFVVRTLVVPAAAALLGPRLWWPARVAPDSA